ncbi:MULTISPECIES: adenosylcobinamide-GDP ribazoletransferase [unclassified Clostridium]|uniref:adenosylcobinamide-GDP ribazoletransferase n=1 Tax=unclassified Clostridium TaxID=2614128 RepID=UPI0018988B50|nr:MULTISPECIES: adenosylcobinamide-GDP ribazoletransferase [unclassified Clostridium]MBP3915329.1 adenosylcobinamide-GDP ribazoletransferase [Clostridium sp.]MEE0933179.1 adenosylcobinamide-GDP ribazoletransferase [Clostridium sp.]
MKKYFKGFLMAISMFTVIPLPRYEWDDEGGKNIMKFYPAIGLIVGLIWYVVFRVLTLLGASIMVITAITLITPFILTGMLHLDGYMDVCDALLSRRDKQEKLRILKDPHTGAFSVISVVMLFVVNFSGLYTVISNSINNNTINNINTSAVGLILIPIISRSLMGYLLLSKDSMKGSSLGAFFKQGTGKVDRFILLACLTISSIIAIFIFGIYGVIMSLAMILVSTFLVNSAAKEFDGMSGDSAGYGLVIAETIGVLILSFI